MFIISAGSDERLESSISLSTLAAHGKGCSMENCGLDAAWKQFKADKAYHKSIKAHRVRNGKMEAKSPPGWKHTIEHMKEHSNIDNPFALAWYMHDKGDTSHKKSAPKGMKGEGGIREQLEQRHESGMHMSKAKKHIKSDKEVGDIQAPKKRKKVKAENLDTGVSMSKK